jgi:hypothetical protein
MNSHLDQKKTNIWLRGALPLALALSFVAVVLLSDRQMSQTFDEGFHLVAGYRYLQCGDFGINPEHPPLVKMVAASALRLTKMPAPAGGTCGQEETTKDHGYSLGVSYLYKEGLDAQQILFKARAATVIFAVLLMTGVFLYARLLFGYWGGVLALLLAACEPTLIAHAALVTTDMAVSAGVLLSVFALDMYLRRPSRTRLLLAGLAVGLTLSVKHSGVIIVPIVIALFAIDLFLRRYEKRNPPQRLGLYSVALIAIFWIAIACLWATYGFRYWPRPDQVPMTLSLADFLTQVRAQGTTGFMPDHLIPWIARFHLLPLAYLYGLVDVLNVSHPGLPPFILGRLLPHGVWYYFPVTFLIKSTPAFLLMIFASIFGGGWLRPDRRRTAIFLLAPVCIWYGIAMTSGLDIGYRHVLPTVALLAVFAAGGVLFLVREKRKPAITVVVALLIAAHAGSAVRAYPNYFPYSDEFLGGEKHTYKYLTDSNNDWGQALFATSRWLKQHGISDCWIAYDGAADLAYYGVPCRVLPGNPGDLQELPPEQATGLFIISGLSYAGVEWEPGVLQPYAVFHQYQPEDNIAGAMLVYRGTFDLRGVQAVDLIIRGNRQLEKDPASALRDAQASLALRPTSVRARLLEARALDSLGRREDAKTSFTAALDQANRTGAAWYPAQIAEARRGLQQH